MGGGVVGTKTGGNVGVVGTMGVDIGVVDIGVGVTA
jgi:hypothetical protein